MSCVSDMHVVESVVELVTLCIPTTLTCSHFVKRSVMVKSMKLFNGKFNKSRRSL